MSTKSSKNSSLQRLRSLVGELSDRDEQMKKDVQLFEEFFESFPIPVTMWSITQEKAILSKRGNGFVHHEASSLDDLFLCPKVKELSIEKHNEALQGKSVDYFAKSDTHVFYVKLLPRYDSKNVICGVTGVSWDVTSNAVILSCLEDIFDFTKERRGDYKKLNEMSGKALAASRLRKLLLLSED